MKTPPHPLLHLLLVLLLPTITMPSTPPNSRQIDNIIHSAAIHSYPKHHKTAVPYNVSLPPTLSTATALAIRHRAGRLRRKGIVFNSFLIPPGLVAHPHSPRLLIVLQNLGNLSSSFYSLPGYNLISPVLGLLVYDAVGLNSTELDVKLTEKPIEVNFSMIVGEIKEEFLCAVFGLGGGVEVLGIGRVCFVKGQGHVGLVVKGGKGKKVVVVVAAVAVVVAVMVGMVAVAVAKGKRKECRMVEMERRGCEDEELRVSMVGGLRVYTAAAVRTPPAMETEDGLPMGGTGD